MSIPPEVVQALVIAAQVAPALFTGLMGALNPDAQEAVLAQVAASQRAMPQPVSPEVEALIARHQPAPAPAVAARFRIAPSTTRTLADILQTRGMQLSGEERVELAAAHALVEAFDRGEVVLASPLAPPVLFAEPDHGED